MAASFTLTLDTVGPAVTFGDWTGQIGAPLIVPYTLNEGSVLSAKLVDSTSAEFPMAVEPTRVTLMLDSSVATGAAYVEITARDSVLNVSNHQQSITLVDSFKVSYQSSPVTLMRVKSGIGDVTETGVETTFAVYMSHKRKTATTVRSSEVK